ncbi:MAG: histidine kinase [Clostridia bacterium]|nr:histidine kinase [Clostridia bacterium]
MKAIASLKKAFWNKYRHLALFRRLRPRIMAMMLTLVLPVSLTCLIISIISMLQGRELIEMNSQNAFSLFLDRMAIRYENGAIDPLDGFPSQVANDLSALVNSVQEEFHGEMYVSRDGQEAWRVFPNGITIPVEESYESLSRSGHFFSWQDNDNRFQAMAVFHYDFSLSMLPVPFWIGIILSLLTALFCPILYKRLKLDILDPLSTLDTALEGVKNDRSYRIPPQPGRNSDEFLHLFEEFNIMAQEVQASYEKDVKMLETEMDNLRLQVNPHMLLNSYNMIYALAESKNYAVIQDYTLCLVDYFRYVLRRGQNLVSVQQELEFVDNFIRIQRIRFPGRFSYVYQAEDDAMQAMIPPLLIENFVENAIKYALDPTRPIEIVVTARTEEEEGESKLHIAISDTGSGIRPEVLEKLKAREPYVDEAGQKHIGIWNCVRRIELFYGEEGEIHFSSGMDQGTQIYLIIPCRRAEEEEER